MPVAGPTGAFPAVPGQVVQQSQAPTTSYNLGQMKGQVLQWNPDLPPTQAQKWINDCYRDVIARRNWSGLKVRGQVTVPNIYSVGQVSISSGSPNLTGVGTAWDQTFVGRQLRLGFGTGFYNISVVTDATHLILDIPWGNASVTNSGYTIQQPWVSLGYNIKSIKTIVNQRQGYQLYKDVPQEILNAGDTWRTSTGWTYLISPKEPSASGSPQYELYPSPTFQQAFPFLAYTQPPDLVNDSDFPVSFLRSDIMILPAIANALVFRGPKLNRFYDPSTSAMKLREFGVKLEGMINEDDKLDPKDLEWEKYQQYPYSKMGSEFLRSHAFSIWDD